MFKFNGLFEMLRIIMDFRWLKKQLQTTAISTWLTFPSLMIKVCKQITQKNKIIQSYQKHFLNVKYECKHNGSHIL